MVEDNPEYNTTPIQLVLIRGLPGSGKSTMARTLAMVGYAHVEADKFFETENGDYVFNPNKLHLAHAWCKRKAEVALQNRLNCVVSNTFTQAWEVKPYEEIAKTFKAKLVILQATGSWKSIHNVPETSIEKMEQRWQHLPNQT